MTRQDADTTDSPPVWQMSWISEYLWRERFMKYHAFGKDVGAVFLPSFKSSAPRYLIAEEAAKRIIFTHFV